MRPNLKCSGAQPLHKKQRGSMLIIVVFMAVVLAVLVTAMASFIADSSQKTSVEVRAARALLAAQSGLEYAFYRIGNPNGGDNLGFCDSLTKHPLSFDGISGLSQCQASITCKPIEDTDGFTMTSEGSCGIALDVTASSKDDTSTDFAVSRILVAEAQ